VLCCVVLYPSNQQQKESGELVARYWCKVLGNDSFGLLDEYGGMFKIDNMKVDDSNRVLLQLALRVQFLFRKFLF
jgi:hypothetical protein